MQSGKIKIKAEVQFPGTHAPTPAELEIESVPYDLPMCYTTMCNTSYGRNTSLSSKTMQTDKKPVTLSDAEKAKLLQEVEAQQADFGLQK